MDNNTDNEPWANYSRHIYIPAAYVLTTGPCIGSAAHQQAATAAYNVSTLDAQGDAGAVPLTSSHLSHIGDHFENSSDIPTTFHMDAEEAATETLRLPNAAAAVAAAAATVQQDRAPFLQEELQNVEAAFQNATDDSSSNASTLTLTPRLAAGTGTYVPTYSNPPANPTPMTYSGQMFQPGAVPATYSNPMAGAGYYNPQAAWPETPGMLIPSWAVASAVPSPQKHLFQGQYDAFSTPSQYTDVYGTAYATGLPNPGSLNFGQGYSNLWDQHLYGGFGQMYYTNASEVPAGVHYMTPTYTAPDLHVSQYDMGSSLPAPIPNAVAWERRNVRVGMGNQSYQRAYGNNQGRSRATRAVASTAGGPVGASQLHLSPCSYTNDRFSPTGAQHAGSATPSPLLAFQNHFQSEDLHRVLSSGGQSLASNDPSETGSAYSYLTSQYSEPLPPQMPRRPTNSGSGNSSRPASQRMSRRGSSQSAPRLIAPNYARAEQQQPSSAQRYTTPPTSNTSQEVNTSSTSSHRGKRRRPLTPETKKNSNFRRGEKSVCIWCKLSGIGCEKLLSNSDICQGCKERGTELTCSRFYFMDLVDAVSTQFAARQYLGSGSPERNGSSPSSTIQILEHVRELAGTRDIRVVADGKRVYDMDLEKSYRFLTSPGSGQPSLEALPAFVDAQAQKQYWSRCVVIGGSGFRSSPGPAQQQQQQDPLRTLALFDDVLPSRVTYKLVYRSNGAEEELRPDSTANQLTLLIANLLTLIFGRQVEHAAFLSLHKRLSKPHLLKGDDLDLLASRLFALRWRYCLSKRRLASLSLTSPGRAKDSEVGELSQCVERLRDLSQKLYFCFCCVREKRRNHHTLRDEFGRDGRTHFYAGARRAVIEGCPEVYNPAGFEQWMLDGDSVVQQADLAEYY